MPTTVGWAENDSKKISRLFRYAVSKLSYVRPHAGRSCLQSFRAMHLPAAGALGPRLSYWRSGLTVGRPVLAQGAALAGVMCSGFLATVRRTRQF